MPRDAVTDDVRDPLRERPLAELDRILSDAAPSFGVARAGDITRLDDLGLPTFTAVRADPIGESVSVCTGKGRTLPAARVSALAEALERYCAEPRGRIAVTTAREDELAGPFVASAAIIPGAGYEIDGPIDWCRGRRLADDRPVWVPANVTFFPYQPSAHARRLCAAATHGLAVGASRAEAVVHGLLECIERDAYARAVALASVDRGELVPVIAPVAIEAAAPTEVAAIRRAGLHLLARDLTHDLEIPAVLCVITDGALAHMGIAARPCGERALRAALAEAAQSRLTDLQGAREDLPPRDGEAVARWFVEAGASPVVALPRTPGADAGVAATLRTLLERLARAGLHDPVAVDLDLAGVDLSVVRVVAPGLEVWAHDPSRIGARARTWLMA